MYIDKILLGSLVSTLIIVLLNFITSSLPWGAESVERNKMFAHEIDHLIDQKEEAMNLILTEKSMSFVITRPIKYYAYERFFSLNLISSLFSGILLTFILYSFREKTFQEKIVIGVLMGLFCISYVHLNYWNWWGFSLWFTLEISLANLLTMILITFVLSKFIFTNRSISRK